MLTAALFSVWYAAIAANAVAVIRRLRSRRSIADYPILFVFLVFSLVQAVLLVDRRHDFQAYRSLWASLAVVSIFLEIGGVIEALDRAARKLHRFGRWAGWILSISAIIATLVAISTHHVALADMTAATMSPYLIAAMRMIYVLLVGLFALSWAAFPHTSETRNLATWAVYLSVNLLGIWLIQTSNIMAVRWIAQFLVVGGSGIACAMWWRIRLDADVAGEPMVGSDADDQALRDEIKRRLR